MTLLGIFIGISVAVVGLVVYSTVVVSSRQEQIAQRVREENSFKRAPYSSYAADRFSFEIAEDLMENELKECGELEKKHF
ncbi:MAG: hypothetical protein FWG67_01170 [Defluviitaleaceae bacterium]|nr:hypothetical protein [Defluviitaleaceae bacterium]